ncbi:hydantoinase/oxoprolinase N-terminal domain-containing protein [Gordonia amicalis]|uniref:hydantoinase/oxoprolinase N-terminal domain-containing protein n=1 Tax=Gordonia amicalis TaxID=89053 RepID=UPI0020D089A2|nr:hydantoinase/oxoprolinase N-terminal domain-containing protein [Gordonia amicalis]
MKRIGVDVGGTFTDLVLWDDDGTVTVHKTPSTNHDPSIGTMAGSRCWRSVRASTSPTSRCSSTGPPWPPTSCSSTTAATSA